MIALIFVIVVAAVVVAMVIGVQKNKKKQEGKEPEISKAAVPVVLEQFEAFVEFKKGEIVATIEEQEALLKLKKAIKANKMAAKPSQQSKSKNSKTKK